MTNTIRFECKKCGTCCGVGFIYLKKGEAAKIAAYLGMPLNQFKKQYTEWFIFLGRALKWSKKGSCLFLKNNQCSVYAARPSQCATWPYWKRLKKNKKELERAKAYCKGIES